MNHHATLSNPIYNGRKYSIGVAYRLCNNLPLLLAILFLVSRMGFSFSPSFTNKKRPNRFALHNEVQLRLSNISYIEMVQQQTIAETLTAEKANKSQYKIMASARTHALLNVFYKGSYIEPPQWLT
ncbi:MAG TPA: hypothetical protein PKC85_12280 [Bacteroidia bacterium]|nr:hypothetical protein [Bacteroidia bacterium]HMU20606.1 hypothetical protein [Bacteroidia bacterium]